MQIHASNPATLINGIPTYASGDPKTSYRHRTSTEILEQYGSPRTLLSTSAKVDKCGKVGVLASVLYMTPGLFCPSSTAGCRAGCLGHTSGHMHMPGPTRARDQRAAFYIEHQDQFIAQLKEEIARHVRKAEAKQITPAIRLNGTSDISWERVHRDVFDEFPHLQFYDYTKVRVRIPSFLSGTCGSQGWPGNYHLTFSGDGNYPEIGKKILHEGGTVAVVFSPDLPATWWGYPVIDGDAHDARFLDPKGVIVGLRAKGIAKVDLGGFVVHCCPECHPLENELMLIGTRETTHRELLHRCERCGFESKSKWILPQSLKQRDCEHVKPAGEPLQLRLAV